MTIIPPASKIITHYGLYSTFNYNFHISDFSKLPGIPNCCPKFTKGSGPGFGLGLFAEFPFYNEISFILKGGF